MRISGTGASRSATRIVVLAGLFLAAAGLASPVPAQDCASLLDQYRSVEAAGQPTRFALQALRAKGCPAPEEAEVTPTAPGDLTSDREPSRQPDPDTQARLTARLAALEAERDRLVAEQARIETVLRAARAELDLKSRKIKKLQGELDSLRKDGGREAKRMQAALTALHGVLADKLERLVAAELARDDAPACAEIAVALSDDPLPEVILKGNAGSAAMRERILGFFTTLPVRDEMTIGSDGAPCALSVGELKLVIDAKTSLAQATPFAQAKDMLARLPPAGDCEAILRLIDDPRLAGLLTDASGSELVGIWVRQGNLPALCLRDDLGAYIDYAATGGKHLLFLQEPAP